MIWQEIFNLTLVENLGWTLLHSVWQIALIALVLFSALKILAKSAANSRYLVSLFALVLSFALPVATFVWLSGNSTQATQNPANFSADKTAILDRRAQPNEDFSSDKNLKLTDTKDKNFFVSIENLQNGFAEKFSVFSPLLVGLWLFGVAFFAFRFVGSVWQLRIYKTREIYTPSNDWQEKFAHLCEKLKIKQSVKFVQSKLVETPMVIGWLKPIILVPTSVFLQINARELETILAHELIHIRRYDYPVNIAQSFIEILFFYHPCVWWISANVRRERECACDDAVVQTLENAQLIYANALANLEEFRQMAKQTAPPILVAANGGKLMLRIQRILQKNTEIKRANSAWSAGLAFVLISAVLLGVFSFNSGMVVNAQKKTATKKMAIGFVSIPPNFRDKTGDKFDETARILIQKLTERKVPAIGFVLGAGISDGEKMFPARANIVRMWRDAGLEVGIGGFKHIWFYDTKFDDYVANVLKNEEVVKPILAEKNLQLRYFSYPFLNTGKDLESKVKFENWLIARGYKSIPYTFDNQEWMYSFAYDKARENRDTETAQKIKAEFLDYMGKMLAHYEAYSNEMFGRDIAQTLVLTPSRLVADSADELFGIFEKRGYNFVPMDEALSDEAYKTPENFTGVKAGISWFERWQMAQGKKLRDEPKVSAEVWKTWEETKTKK